jgi:hypothetical protein
VFATIMKFVSIAALLAAAMSWRSVVTYRLWLDFAVFMGAIVVMQQAFRFQRYGWTATFVGIAVLFNPVVPLPRSAGAANLLMISACLLSFAVSLAALRTRPLLSIPSITDRTPGSESL